MVGQRLPPAIAEFEATAEFADQRTASLGDEIVAEMACPLGVPRRCSRHRQPCHFDFVAAGCLGHFFDRLAVAVAGGEFLPGINPSRLATQNGFDQTDFLEERGPIDGIEQSQTGDAVADGYLIRGLSPMLADQHFSEVVRLTGQPIAERANRHIGFAIAERLVPGDQKCVSWLSGQGRWDR